MACGRPCFSAIIRRAPARRAGRRPASARRGCVRRLQDIIADLVRRRGGFGSWPRMRANRGPSGARTKHREAEAAWRRRTQRGRERRQEGQGPHRGGPAQGAREGLHERGAARVLQAAPARAARPAAATTPTTPAQHLRENEITTDPSDRATLEEEYTLELRTRDRERKLLKKVEKSLQHDRRRQLRLLRGDRRADRHPAPARAADGDAVARGAGAPRARPEDCLIRRGTP